MDMDGHQDEREDMDSQMREHREGDLETEKSSKHRRKSKDHRSKDRSKKTSDDVSKDKEKGVKDFEKDRVLSGDKRKEDRDEHDRDRSKDAKSRERDYERDKHREKEREREREKERERDREKDRKDKGKEKDRGKDRDVEETDRGRDKERGKEKSRERDKDKEREREKAKEKDREKNREREKQRDYEKDRDKERAKEKTREKDKEADKVKERLRDRDRTSKKAHEDVHESGKDEAENDNEDNGNRVEDEQVAKRTSGGVQVPTLELEERILKMRHERPTNKSQGVSEVLAWVNRSRKLEDKRYAEKERALQLSKIFEEQENIVQEESENDEAGQNDNLAGVKVLHGIDKVMEGGAVVLTLKDQNILADGDINNEVDMLENVEIGEQKRRDDAYKAAKKKTGLYDDKFNDDPGSEKKILPQYDDPAADEGMTLDERGRITDEAEKKLEELRRKLQRPLTNRFEDLEPSSKISSDYYTHEEMLQFKKPKKKKSLRKKEKLDIDALEAEAVAAGLGAGDLGSRNDGRRQAVREEQERYEAALRNNAYQSAYTKADEASKSLRLEQTLPVKVEEDENNVFAADDDDLHKSLERVRKLALKKQEEPSSGPQAVALLATSTTSNQTTDDQNPTNRESQENMVVFTEMEEFVWGLQLDEEAHKPEGEDVFMDEDEAPRASNQEIKDEVGGWMEVKDSVQDENPAEDDKEEVVPDETIHEVPIGKGLSGALKLFKERGTLKESIEWGGRNMDKKKSKLVGIVDDDGNNDRFKDIRIERTDEFGRIMTPKEAFRMISHKFHGKGPGKMKQEKRMKQYQEELKLKQMKNSDTPSLSVERMREAQARLKTPYLVLSGHVKPGQTSDPTSGFATVEKDVPGSLTPMLGDKKVEHFLGIKRRAETGNGSTQKKPKI
ncbi:SART-1 family protein DOT2 isoform X2 [Carica papaya]|uniref:SART-1 family protein DOT2 isoform X2 n=1 Tax=Carica papaya TaxID=3649 RepID=UPI000B8CAF1E|nr:SART-1 family protein DOT2 isoform X2 [Carica papaya]